MALIMVAAFGCTLGIVPHMAATITGLAALLHTSAVAFQALKYLGVAYLLYLAWATLVNLLNPKLTIFFLAFLPQFVDAGQPGSVLRMLGLSGVFMLVTFVVFAGYGTFAAAVRDHVVGRPRVTNWIRRIFAGSFAGLGATLALAQR
jgi:threonine/homoserine/homoserine lactone efflux protein